MELSRQQAVAQLIPPEQPMSIPPHKEKKQFKLRWRPLLVIVAILYVLASFAGLQLELRRVDARISELEERKAALLAEQQRLLAEKEKLNNPVYIERRAREALGLIKPGEKVLVPAEPGKVLALKLEGIDEIGD